MLAFVFYCGHSLPALKHACSSEKRDKQRPGTWYEVLLYTRVFYSVKGGGASSPPPAAHLRADQQRICENQARTGSTRQGGKSRKTTPFPIRIWVLYPLKTGEIGFWIV